MCEKRKWKRNRKGEERTEKIKIRKKKRGRRKGYKKKRGEEKRGERRKQGKENEEDDSPPIETYKKTSHSSSLVFIFSFSQILLLPRQLRINPATRFRLYIFSFYRCCYLLLLLLLRLPVSVQTTFQPSRPFDSFTFVSTLNLPAFSPLPRGRSISPSSPRSLGSFSTLLFINFPVDICTRRTLTNTLGSFNYSNKLIM